jgi:ClpP class serine protease
MGDAVRAFRDAGKPVYASLSGGGEKEYLLAAAADRVAMPPVSTLQLDGLSASALFMRGTYDKLAVRPNFQHVGRYKSAVETFTRGSLSPDAREAMEALLDDQYETLVRNLAMMRDVTGDSMRALIDGGPYAAAVARERGLVDTLIAVSDVDSLAVHEDGQKLGTVSLRTTSTRAVSARAAHRAGVAEGDIVDGKSREARRRQRLGRDRTRRSTPGHPRAEGHPRGRAGIGSPAARATPDGVAGTAPLRRGRGVSMATCRLGATTSPARCGGGGPASITGSIGVFGASSACSASPKLGLNGDGEARPARRRVAIPGLRRGGARAHQRTSTGFYRVRLARVEPSMTAGPWTPWAGARGQGAGAQFGWWTASAACRRLELAAGLRSARTTTWSRSLPAPRRTFVQRWLRAVRGQGRRRVCPRSRRWRVYRLAGMRGCDARAAALHDRDRLKPNA